jgi:hypothetical protein
VITRDARHDKHASGYLALEVLLELGVSGELGVELPLELVVDLVLLLRQVLHLVDARLHLALALPPRT